MWLILAPSDDDVATWVYAGLRARGLSPLELITDVALSNIRSWEHRLGAAGDTVTIQLVDGRTIRSDDLRGTINRLLSAPFGTQSLAQPSDREYAMQELHALYMSWLKALPGLTLNPPVGQCLSGEYRHLSEWTWLAARAGLPTKRYRQSSLDPLPDLEASWSGGDGRLCPPGEPPRAVVVMAGRTFGVTTPPTVQAGCRRLADLVQTPLLGVDFVTGEGGPWTFHGATPSPDLRLGGESLLNALFEMLQNGTGTHR